MTGPDVPFDVFELINADRAKTQEMTLSLYQAEHEELVKLRVTVAEVLGELEQLLEADYMPSAARLWTALFPLWSKIEPVRTDGVR